MVDLAPACGEEGKHPGSTKNRRLAMPERMELRRKIPVGA
jgi:hypothetical protein